MKTHTLKTLLFSSALTLTMALSSYGLDTWLVIGGSYTTPPTYKAELHNAGTQTVNIQYTSLGGFSYLGIPAQLAPGQTLVLDIPLQNDMQSLVGGIDSTSYYFPESFNFNCPVVAGGPFHIQYKLQADDVNNPGTMLYFMVDVDYCLEGKCDLTVSPFPASVGYLKMVFTDSTL